MSNTHVPTALPTLRAVLVRIDPTVPTRGDRHTLTRESAVISWRYDESGLVVPILLSPALPDEMILIVEAASPTQARTWYFDRPLPSGAWTTTEWRVVLDECMRRFVAGQPASEPTPEPAITTPAIGAVDDHWGTGQKPKHVAGPRAVPATHPRETF